MKWGSSISEPVRVLSGVPQGSVLGPLLFLIYVNDLPQNLSCSVRLYADDLVIYQSVENNYDCENLQRNLNVLGEWCNTWLMDVNVQKTKVMSLSRARTHVAYKYVLRGTALERVDKYKYLGVFISKDLSWKYHVEQLCLKAARTLGFLKRTLFLAPPQVKMLAYNSLVRSKLEYAAVIWSPHQKYLIEKLEIVQNNALRFVFNIRDRLMSMSALRTQYGIPLLSARRKVLRLVLIFKLYHSTSSYINRAHFSSGRVDHPWKIHQVLSHTDAHKFSTLALGIAEWNDLPIEIVSVIDVNCFQALCEEMFC